MTSSSSWLPTGGHRARKRFGQNFLRDAGIISRIVACIRPQKGQRIVEIGPGQGAITEQLLEATGALDAIELDRDLITGLRTQFFAYPEFILHQADALKFDFASFRGDGLPLRVVGNLPYNISTPLIFHLLASRNAIEDMHFMLQKEVVARLAATPGSGAWGRLSVMTQYFCRVDDLFDVPPEAFVPRPKVDSAIVRLVPHQQLPYPANDYETFESLVRTGFSQRRKTLRNNLKGVLTAEQIEALKIDPARRPETISLEEWVRLANAVSASAQE